MFNGPMYRILIHICVHIDNPHDFVKCISFLCGKGIVTIVYYPDCGQYTYIPSVYVEFVISSVQETVTPFNIFFFYSSPQRINNNLYYSNSNYFSYSISLINLSSHLYYLYIFLLNTIITSILILTYKL